LSSSISNIDTVSTDKVIQVRDYAKRTAGICFGIGTQVLFLVTVVQLFLFLRFGGGSTYHGWWIVDSILAVGFVLPHSILLVPEVQARMKKWLPAGMLGCVHCVTTCLTLLVLFREWGRSEIIIWQASGAVKVLVLVFFYGAWVGLFYSLYLTGLGYQTGLTQWWYWLIRKRPPARQFVTRGAFRWMRHPVYMSFLGLIWFTPVMTLDHAILTAVWTVYIYLGSYHKDRRLIRFIGKEYIEYGKRVSGLPGLAFGSLHRFPKDL
jgi:methanethiol S-methyltransferase